MNGPRAPARVSGFVVPKTNLAICWKIRLVSDATRFELKSSDNAFGADNQQERRQQWMQESQEYQRKSDITWQALRMEKEVLISPFALVKIIRFLGKSPLASMSHRKTELFSLFSKGIWAAALFAPDPMVFGIMK